MSTWLAKLGRNFCRDRGFGVATILARQGLGTHYRPSQARMIDLVHTHDLVACATEIALSRQTWTITKKKTLGILGVTIKYDNNALNYSL